jgi:PIN domain nuclease of toxin-antitoxin system
VYLLDTHVLIWAYHKPERLSQAAVRAIESGAVTVSAASLWELELKRDKKGSPVADPTEWWSRYVTLRGVAVLGIQAYHIQRLASLPPIHKDPFDRILVCQALHEKMDLVTDDDQIRRYAEVLTPVW